VVGRAAALAKEARVIRRLVAAAVLLVAAVFFALLARDAWHWSRAIQDADARATFTPISASAWQAHTTLPSGLTRRLLGIDDDLAFRRTATRALRLAAQEVTATNQKQRSVAESALARIVRGPDPQRASIAADYLGVMLYADPPSLDQAANPYQDPSQSGPSDQETPEQKARTQFAVAARLDPDNDEAQRHLELMLRTPQAPPHKGVARPGGGEQLGNKGSGARPPGRGY
jgi:hypothetical protein